MSNSSLIPKPFDITDAKRRREEEDRLAERRDGAAWVGVIAETVAREDLATVTEAQAQATREQIVAEALARAEAFIDVDRSLAELDEKYDGVITDAGLLGTKLAAAEGDIADAKTRLDTAAADISDAFGRADAALVMAGSKSKVFYSTDVQSGTGTAAGDLWRQIDAAKNVIAEWYWTGTEWQPSQITTSVISNLDVGKLSAGSAEIPTLVSQKIAAAAGEFIELDVKQLRVTGSAAMSQAVIDKLWTDVVNSRKITTQMMAVGAFDNLIPDPGFTNTGLEWGAAGGAYSFPATAGRTGGGAFRIAVNASQSGKYSARIPASGAANIRVNVWVKSDTFIPINGLGIYVNRKLTATGAAGAAIQILKRDSGTAGNESIPANTWTKLTAVATVLDDWYDFAIGFYTQTNFTSGTVWYSEPSATRMNAGELTVDGTVTARQMESELVLATKIVAGDPASTHAEMSPLGFKVYAAPVGGGTPTEVVRLGVAATDDYFAVTKADGSLAATISQDGKISSDQMNANKSLWYKGDEMQTILDRLPRGIISAAYRATNSTVNAAPGADIPYLRLEADLLPGRIYKVWTSPMTVSLTAGITLVFLKHNQGALATLSSPGLTQAFVADNANAPVLQELYAVTAPTRASFLLGMGVLGGQSGFAPTSSNPVRLVVEDIGPASNQIGNGTSLNGTTPPPPAVNTYIKQYGSNASMNYQGNNAQYNWDTGHMYQGLSPAGMGNLKSISLHPDMTADLSGATVNYIRVYFTFNHWYYNAGGTARIGLHGHTSIPGTFSGSGIAIQSGGWPKPGARWVDLPSSVFAGFKSGAYRGIYLEGDSSYGTYGIADRPTIEIGYTK